MQCGFFVSNLESGSNLENGMESIENLYVNNTFLTLITSASTVALAFLGYLQYRILKTQSRENQISLIEELRMRYNEKYEAFGILVFIGRDPGDYYQILPDRKYREIQKLISTIRIGSNAIWAVESAKSFFSYLSSISAYILQNQLNIQDVYHLFGTQLLRQSLPLKVLLDDVRNDTVNNQRHKWVMNFIQDWLKYHDGIRRRSLILLDLLWAEGARLGDLPPYDLEAAALIKLKTGKLNKKRIIEEYKKLNSSVLPFSGYKFSCYLKYAEFRKYKVSRGLEYERIEENKNRWIEKLLSK